MRHALSVDWPGARIPEYVRELTTVAIAVISRDGILIDANRGFFSLLPDEMMAVDVLDMRDVFVSPRFDEFAVRSAGRLGGAIHNGILNLGCVNGRVCSLHGALYALTDSVLMVAEHEVSGLELLRARLLHLNDELAEGQRNLAWTVRELNRQKELAAAAIRERDALHAQLDVNAG